MSIGLPYKGSKSEIAEELVAKLPPCGKILDACCGGGAVLVALAQSLKYKSVVGNDRNPATIALLDAVLIHKGQIEYEHPEPCSRNDFFVSLQRIENDDFTIQDCVNKYCASFGNDGKTYLYGKEIERAKVSAETMLTAPTLEQRRHAYRDFMRCLIDEGGGSCVGFRSACKTSSSFRKSSAYNGWNGWNGWTSSILTIPNSIWSILTSRTKERTSMIMSSIMRDFIRFSSR